MARVTPDMPSSWKRSRVMLTWLKHSGGEQLTSPVRVSDQEVGAKHRGYAFGTGEFSCLSAESGHLFTQRCVQIREFLRRRDRSGRRTSRLGSA